MKIFSIFREYFSYEHIIRIMPIADRLATRWQNEWLLEHHLLVRNGKNFKIYRYLFKIVTWDQWSMMTYYEIYICFLSFLSCKAMYEEWRIYTIWINIFKGKKQVMMYMFSLTPSRHNIVNFKKMLLIIHAQAYSTFHMSGTRSFLYY